MRKRWKTSKITKTYSTRDLEWVLSLISGRPSTTSIRISTRSSTGMVAERSQPRRSCSCSTALLMVPQNTWPKRAQTRLRWPSRWTWNHLSRTRKQVNISRNLYFSLIVSWTTLKTMSIWSSHRSPDKTPQISPTTRTHRRPSRYTRWKAMFYVVRKWASNITKIIVKIRFPSVCRSMGQHTLKAISKISTSWKTTFSADTWKRSRTTSSRSTSMAGPSSTPTSRPKFWSTTHFTFSIIRVSKI